MSKALTIRIDEALREALEERARAQGKTGSELAREILRGALRASARRADEPPEGGLRLGRKQTEAWRESLRQRNWRD